MKFIITQKGNFGELITELLKRDDIDDCFVHHFTRPIRPFINKLFLTPYNKIALSIPFKPSSFQKNIKNNTTLFKANRDGIKILYNSLANKDYYLNLLNPELNFEIEYNYDYQVGHTSWFSLPPVVLKTNRYSMTIRGKYGVYDYDNITDNKEVIPIYKYFEEIEN